MRWFLSSISIAIVLLAGASPASAQADWATCAKANGDEAIAACGRLIKSGKRKGNELAVVYTNRCSAFDWKKEFDRAIDDCNEAIRLNAKAAGAYVSRCWAWMDKQDLERAMEDCNTAIRLQPENSTAHNNRCNLFIRKREYDRALADCNQAVRLNPKSVVAHNNRCVVWKSKNEPDRAIADCNEAIHLNPKYANAYLGRAQAWRDKGEFEHAIADFSEVIRLDPKLCGCAYSSRGLLFETAGELEKALADFRAAAASNSQDAGATERVRRVERKLAPEVDTKPTTVAAPVAAPKPVAAAPPTLEPKPVVVATPAPDPKPVAAPPQAAPKPVAAPPAVSEPKPTVAALPPPAPPNPSAAPGAEVRVALVIGNSAYVKVGTLPNAANDAAQVAAALQRIGFTTVMLDLDLPRGKLVDALRNFGQQADQSDWAMVYYAGHGIEFGGKNYLVPTDARLASDRDIALEAVALDHVLLAVEGARKLRLVVLDACRENPFITGMSRMNASRAIGRGLARVEPEGATLVIYSAKDGQVALDGDGINSPFASAFLRHLETPGFEVNFLFRKVRDDVLVATQRRQEPYVYGSLPAQPFYFRTP